MKKNCRSDYLGRTGMDKMNVKCTAQNVPLRGTPPLRGGRIFFRFQLNMAVYAGIIGISALFIWTGVSYFIAAAVGVTAFILLLNLVLCCLGRFIGNKYSISGRAARSCSVLFSVLTIIISLLGLIYVMQDAMIFINVPYREAREFIQGMQGVRYIEVSFTAENGKTYNGVMFRAYDEKAPLVIYFGGNAEVSFLHVQMRSLLGQWGYFAGFNYLVIDYEGYGINEGRTNYRNIYEGALAVFDFAVTLPYVDSERIVVKGFSLGTGAAVYLAANRPVAGLILAAPFAAGHDLYNNVLPIFRGPLRRLVNQRFPSYEHAPNVLCPVLVIASRNDEIIPFSSSERLAGLFPGDVDFMILDNERHNFIFQGSGVFNRVQSFLEGIR